MSVHWEVTVTRGGSDVVAIGTNYLSGKSHLTLDDEEAIRLAALNLLSFIGDYTNARLDNALSRVVELEAENARLREWQERAVPWLRKDADGYAADADVLNRDGYTAIGAEARGKATALYQLIREGSGK